MRGCSRKFQTDRALLLKGEILLRRENFAEALRAFNRIQDRAHPYARRGSFGECLIQLNEPFQAEQLFRFVLAENPNHIDAHRYLGVIFTIRATAESGRPPSRGRTARSQGRPTAPPDRTDLQGHRSGGPAIEAYNESLSRKPNGDLAGRCVWNWPNARIKRGGNERAIELVEGSTGKTPPRSERGTRQSRSSATGTAIARRVARALSRQR